MARNVVGGKVSAHQAKTHRPSRKPVPKKAATTPRYFQLKLPEALGERLDRFIESSTMGYTARAEVVRDLIRHFLYALEDKPTSPDPGETESASARPSKR